MAQRKSKGRVKATDAMTARLERAKAELVAIDAKVAAAKAELAEAELAKRAAAENFAPGDKAQLITGSPAMTVIRVEEIGPTKAVTVLYSADGEIIERKLDARTLMAASTRYSWTSVLMRNSLERAICDSLGVSAESAS